MARCTEELSKEQKNKRLGEEKLNNQGCLMKIVEYNNASNIVIEFQDEYKTKINAQYSHFVRGQIKNPYHSSIYGVGMIGSKYPVSINNKHTKEYNLWHRILERCYSKRVKEKQPAYKDVTCCKEWLCYENFYEWLHEQENFDKWYNGERWAIDKDILEKGNKIYSPKTCCLVPININSLFTKHDVNRGDLPIGVSKNWKRFKSYCHSPLTNKFEQLGTYDTPEEAFQAYKKYKENIIKQVARIEYCDGNITEQCYKAMMEYKVEITD